MASATEAYDALRARLDAVDSGITIPLRWHGEDNGPLPDVPADFAYVVFDNLGSRPGPMAFGGGIGRNLYRNLASRRRVRVRAEPRRRAPRHRRGRDHRGAAALVPRRRHLLPLR